MAKIKKITYTDLLIQISGEYLTENFPQNVADMPPEAVNDFIEEHIYEPFEGKDANEMFELIDAGATCLANFLKSKGIKVINS